VVSKPSDQRQEVVMSRALVLSLVLALGSNVTDPPRSASQAWPLVLACLELPVPNSWADPEAARVAWDRTTRCTEAGRELVQHGDDSDRERLSEVFDELPDNSMLRPPLLEVFLDWHLNQALEDLESREPADASAAPRAVPELPEVLRSAPPELQEAWRLYQRLAEGDEDGPAKPPGETISFQSNRARFERTVAGFLRGRIAPDVATRELMRYEWGGWCGMGSDSLYHPRAKAFMIASLQLGRADLAAQASRSLQRWGIDSGGPQPWDRRLLTAAGIDWERFYLGGVLSDQTYLAGELARRGSDLSALHLLAAARLLSEGQTETDTSLIEALGALVEPGGSCSDDTVIGMQAVERDPEAPAVSAAVQEGVLEFLGERVGPQSGLQEAETASNLLVKRCRPESREVFRTMLASPYGEVRQRGALGLRGLGESLEDPAAPRPVAFRVVVDGKPLAQQQVQWSLEMPEHGTTSSGDQTDGMGILRVTRDLFVDPRRPVSSVTLGMRDLSSADKAWFEVELPVPKALDQVTTASVRLGSLTVVVPESLLAGRPRLALSAETKRYGDTPMMSPIGTDLRVTSARMHFPRLQHGRYSAALWRGSAVYVSPEVEVGDRPVTVRVSERAVGR
jgi:hypothetical protein